MCRARPGPRCSNTGAKRYDTAVKHLAYIEARHAAESADGHTPSARRKRQLANAHRRMEAAKRVFFGTPQGQNHLQDRIETVNGMLANVQPGEPGSQERDTYNRLRALAANLSEEKALGYSRRENSYADLHMVGSERRLLRDEARARGGQMNSRAHPARNMVVTSDPSSLGLRDWSEADVARANSWVEAGANPDWHTNSTVRLPRVVEGVEVGQRVDPSVSRLVRLNTPDGQVVEARYDFHLTKNTEGKYVVSSRALVASSWEDASPIDVTTQDLGHILTATSNVTKRQSKALVGVFDSEDDAKTAMRQALHSADQTYVKSTALSARRSIQARARREDISLQQRGIVRWFRYQH